MQDSTKTTATPARAERRAARRAEQQAKVESNRAWHEERARDAEKRRKAAAKARREAKPSGGRARAAGFIERLFGGTPVTHQAVQMVDRDRSGRPLPVRNESKDRSLAGKARIRARRSARR